MAQTIYGGVDTGNGYIKAALRNTAHDEPERFDIPSGVALMTSSVDIPVPDSEAAEFVAEDFYNSFDAIFDTPLVTSKHRHLFGSRGLKASAPMYEEFNILSTESKAQVDLYYTFIIGLFAAKAVKDEIAATGSVPEEIIKVDATVALALPIREYKSFKTAVPAKLKEGTHTVTVKNFATPVVVRVNFTDVRVEPEGASGQYAIVDAGVALTKDMVADMQEQGHSLPEGVVAEDVYRAKNTVGCDLGEGTINFPVYINGKFNPDSSGSFGEGYGTVLERARVDLEAQGRPFASRKQLADHLLQGPAPTKKAHFAKTKAIVDEHLEIWAEAVEKEFTRVFNQVQHDAEVAYVFGGGSGPLKEFLYPKLLARVGDSFPVLYLDARYSRHLNRAGLLVIAEKMVQKQKK